MSLPSDEFYRLAERLPAYQGVVRARLVIEYERQNGGGQEPAQTVETPLSAAAAASDPTMPGSIEVD